MNRNNTLDWSTTQFCRGNPCHVIHYTSRTQFVYYNGSVYVVLRFSNQISRNDPSGAPPTLPLPHRSPHSSLPTQRSPTYFCSQLTRQSLKGETATLDAPLLRYYDESLLISRNSTKFVLGVKSSHGCKVSPCRYHFQ